MRRAWTALLGTILAAVPAFAQDSSGSPASPPAQANQGGDQGNRPATQANQGDQAAAQTNQPGSQANKPRFLEPPREDPTGYVRAEYLLWWLTSAPNPVPLLTTGDPGNDPRAGTVGATSTQVLFGNRDIRLDSFSGARLTAGYWLGDDRVVGIEANGFFLGEQERDFSFASNASGRPLLAVPFRSLAGEERLLVAAPGGAGVPLGVGSFDASYRTDLWGAEADVMVKVLRKCYLGIDVLAGFCYRGLEEEMNLLYGLTATGAPAFGGTAHDRFATNNDFYGGEIGARLTYGRGYFAATFTAKVGLGDTHQEVEIAGDGSIFRAGGSSAFGVFAQPSNIGTHTHDEFTATPELNVRVSYDLTDHVTVSAGYNAIFWGDVVRPGNQIDRTIDTAAGPGTFFTGLQAGVPATGDRPAARSETSILWAHGVSFGAEFRF